MANRIREKQEAEELKQKDEKVRKALEETAGKKPTQLPKVETKQKFWIGSYLLLLLAFGVAYRLITAERNFFGLADDQRDIARRLVTAAMAIVVILIIQKAVKAYLVEAVSSAPSRYNLNRIVTLLAFLTAAFSSLSIIFVDWYAAALSLTLLSLVLGFALQAPISSFIGWIYLLVKTPYRVGDRIAIGEATGDVIDVSYLDTTLWEFGGPTLSTTNHPSGRIIKFPNSKVLSSAVFNYSWPLFPYIWNDIKFQIAYQSDLAFVAKVMSETVEEELGAIMTERIGVYRELLSQTPVDELEVRERPTVVFRIDDNTWIDAIVRYLVEPRRAGQVKTRLIKKMLERLQAEPDKVMFPKGDTR